LSDCYSKKLGVDHVGVEAETGAPYECPSFFPIGDRHILIFSSLRPTKRLFYQVGRYENFHFSPEYSGTLDHGVMYAPQVFVDRAGRQLMFGWIEEERPTDVQMAVGWSGAMTLPRELGLDESGTLRQTYPEEVKGLRRQHQRFDYSDEPLTAGQTLLPVKGRMLEVQANIQPSQHGQLILRILYSPDEAEYTDIVFDFAEQELRVERTQSSLDPDAAKHPLHTSLRSCLKIPVG